MIFLTTRDETNENYTRQNVHLSSKTTSKSNLCNTNTWSNLSSDELQNKKSLTQLGDCLDVQRDPKPTSVHIKHRKHSLTKVNRTPLSFRNTKFHHGALLCRLQKESPDEKRLRTAKRLRLLEFFA